MKLHSGGAIGFHNEKQSSASDYFEFIKIKILIFLGFNGIYNTNLTTKQ